MTTFHETPFFIALTDLDRFTSEAARRPDLDVANVVHQYYDLVGADIENAGGTVIKFLGDACLSVFPPEAADQAIDVLLDLHRKCDDLMSGFGWKTSMGVRAHFGTVAAGEFGTGANRHFDIVGSNVNLTFRLPATGVVLAVEAFRQLGADRRRLFKKHTPPIFVYTCRSITRASLEEMRMPPEEPTEWWRRSTAGSPSAAKVES